MLSMETKQFYKFLRFFIIFVFKRFDDLRHRFKVLNRLKLGLHVVELVELAELEQHLCLL